MDIGISSKDIDKFTGILEAVLFAAGDPVSIKELCELLKVNEKRMKEIVRQLRENLEDEKRGLMLLEFNNKLQLSSKSEYSNYIKAFLKSDSRQNLSQAAIETLSVIAYKQPITRIEIDQIRGVRSDRAIATLIDNGLIKDCGRKDTPGRPILFGTTEEFLKYFGFKSLKELPELIEFNLDFEEE